MTIFVTAALSILAWAGTMCTAHVSHDRTMTDQLIKDAEKECFELPDDRRNCDALHKIQDQRFVLKVKVRPHPTIPLPAQR